MALAPLVSHTSAAGEWFPSVCKDERYTARATFGALTVSSRRKEMKTRTEAPMNDAR